MINNRVPTFRCVAMLVWKQQNKVSVRWHFYNEQSFVPRKDWCHFQIFTRSDITLSIDNDFRPAAAVVVGNRSCEQGIPHLWWGLGNLILIQWQPCPYLHPHVQPKPTIAKFGASKELPFLLLLEGMDANVHAQRAKLKVKRRSIALYLNAVCGLRAGHSPWLQVNSRDPEGCHLCLRTMTDSHK